MTSTAGVYRFRADLAGPRRGRFGRADTFVESRSFMSQPDDESQEALRRLDQRLDAFDGQRASKPLAAGAAERGVGEGYRLLGEVIGGVVGGIGLGWAFDYFMHTMPIGVVVGLLLGTAASAFVAVKGAERMNKSAAKRD